MKPPAFQAQGPRTPRGQIQVVGNQNRSEPVAHVQSFNQVKNAAGGGLVQVAGRFVGQKAAADC